MPRASSRTVHRSGLARRCCGKTIPRLRDAWQHTLTARVAWELCSESASCCLHGTDHGPHLEHLGSPRKRDDTACGALAFRAAPCKRLVSPLLLAFHWARPPHRGWKKAILPGAGESQDATPESRCLRARNGTRVSWVTWPGAFPLHRARSAAAPFSIKKFKCDTFQPLFFKKIEA